MDLCSQSFSSNRPAVGLVCQKLYHWTLHANSSTFLSYLPRLQAPKTSNMLYHFQIDRQINSDGLTFIQGHSFKSKQNHVHSFFSQNSQSILIKVSMLPRCVGLLMVLPVCFRTVNIQGRDLGFSKYRFYAGPHPDICEPNFQILHDTTKLCSSLNALDLHSSS